jgi:hypothetical protein
MPQMAGWSPGRPGCPLQRGPRLFDVNDVSYAGRDDRVEIRSCYQMVEFTYGPMKAFGTPS